MQSDITLLINKLLRWILIIKSCYSTSMHYLNEVFLNKFCLWCLFLSQHVFSCTMAFTVRENIVSYFVKSSWETVKLLFNIHSEAYSQLYTCLCNFSVLSSNSKPQADLNAVILAQELHVWEDLIFINKIGVKILSLCFMRHLYIHLSTGQVYLLSECTE